MTKQMTNVKNVWEGIHPDSSRRIKADSKHNFFWICDENGKYGLLISIDQKLSEKDFAEKIKGIRIVKNDRSGTGTDLYLVLNDNSDWEIFYSLCNDLLDVSDRSNNDSALIANLKKRLKRWQFFLSESNTLSMPEMQQMGLITELRCLKDLILPNFLPDNSILFWVGSDFDRQDFSLPESFLEVKSFISSKGAVVKISSLYQLVSNIKPLYLLAYGLTRNNNGTSITDVVEEITSLLPHEEVRDLFAQKLAQYGYIDGVTEEPFYKYTIDNVKCFSVSDDFPRILPGQVKDQITSVQYTVDLTRCATFAIELSSIFRQ